jgi:hypothetical protein
MVTWGYVFISSRQPKKVVRAVRKIDGVIHAYELILAFGIYFTVRSRAFCIF